MKVDNFIYFCGKFCVIRHPLCVYINKNEGI